MLWASLQSSRALARGPLAARLGRQWQAPSPLPRTVFVQPISIFSRKRNADKPSIHDSDQPVLPGSASDATSEPPPPGAVRTTPSSSVTPVTPSSSTTIPPQQIPLTPPTPQAAGAQASPGTTTGSTGSGSPTAGTNARIPTPPAKKPRRIFRKLFYTLLLLSIGGFGGGVAYARVNDNFHDFFTEYIPFGEEAVLYFEEREFRKRFPPGRTPRPRDTGNQITIPSQSGVSSKISEDSKKASNQSGANEHKPGEALQTPSDASKKDHVAAVEAVKKDKPTPKAAPAPVAKSPEPSHSPEPVSAKPVEKKPESSGEFIAPEVNEPSRFPPEITRIDPINMKNASEPVVQDLAKLLNDIIAVVNADNANKRFSPAISKAKSELENIGNKIQALKVEASKEADKKIEMSRDDFNRASQEFIKRIEQEMQAQEASWKDEFDSARRKLHEDYDQRLKAEIEAQNQVNEQRLRNDLLEQAVEMQRRFTKEIKDRVEEERDARLGKLSTLSETVNELEKLTTDWNSVVDANLKTQHLHVAVEAVRKTLEKAQTPKPFIRELAALKEIASDDPVVDAAIASINPTAYQKGIPSTAQLIDRFRRVATEVRKAALLPEDAGVASHAGSLLLSKVMFKKKGFTDGDDVESILTRTETLLEEGDLDNAAREMNALKGWAKTLSKDWLSEVRKVLEVKQALDVIATEARLQSLRVE